MSKITKYRIKATIPAGETSGSAYSQVIRGKILSVGINYPAHACTVDLDSDGESASQKVMDLASASTDKTYYPRTPVCINTGAETVLSYTGLKVYEPFLIYGRIKLSLASGTATESVSVELIVEEN